jgi:hypothetical protein
MHAVLYDTYMWVRYTSTAAPGNPRAASWNGAVVKRGPAAARGAEAGERKRDRESVRLPWVKGKPFQSERREATEGAFE